MPNAILIPKLRNAAASYAALRRRVEETLIKGQRRIEAEKVRTYWETGRLINDYIRAATPQGAAQAKRGKEVVLKLADDLGVSERVLYQCVQFHRRFRRVNGRSLSWSHYRALSRIPDEKVRLKWEARAVKQGWTSERLVSRLKLEFKNDGASHPDGRRHRPGNMSGALITPRLGKLYTYQLKRPEEIYDGKPYLLLDLGFSFYRRVYENRFKERQIVESKWREDGSFQLAVSKRSEADLFTYRALVERVVDGDTLRVKIDLGFDCWTRQYLRLRGIDCPELNTAAGQKARRFVEREIGKGPPILIYSMRSDKYDRYLADVFVEKGKGNGKHSEIVYLNNLLLENHHAVRMG